MISSCSRKFYLEMLKSFLGLLLFVSIGACGGGGGDDDECNDSVACIAPDPDLSIDPASFFGEYKVSYSLSYNTCEGSGVLSKLKENYLVNGDSGYHGIPLIVATSDVGISYSSFATKDISDGVSYFQVFQDGTSTLFDLIPGLTCEESIQLYFRNTNNPSGVTVSRYSTLSCESIDSPATYSCNVTYEGSAVRS